MVLKKLLPLYLIIFFGFFGYSLMITIFTPLFMHGDIIIGSIQHRVIILGIMLMLYPLGQFIGSPIAGALSDKFGRKPILIYSLMVVTVAYFLMSLALSWHHVGLLVVALILAGLSESNVAIAQSAIADLTTPQNRGKYFGYIYLSASSAYIVGPLLGGKLADSHLVSWFNAATPFWLSTGLVVVMVLLAMLVLQETHQKRSGEHIRYLQAFTSMASIFTHRRARRLFLVNFCFYLAIFGFFRCYPMYIVEHFKLTVSRESEYIAWVAVPIILSNLFMTSWLLKRMQPKTLAMVAGILAGIFMMIVVIPPQQGFLWVTLFFAGLGAALTLPACATHLSTQMTAQEQGRVMGNNNSLAVLAEAMSGILGGLLAALSVFIPLLVLGLIAWVGVAILLKSR